MTHHADTGRFTEEQRSSDLDSSQRHLPTRWQKTEFSEKKYILKNDK